MIKITSFNHKRSYTHILTHSFTDHPTITMQLNTHPQKINKSQTHTHFHTSEPLHSLNVFSMLQMNHNLSYTQTHTHTQTTHLHLPHK